MCGFIAQLVEQRTGNAEVTGSNPVEALIFFQASSSNCLNWKIHCDDLSSPSSITAVQNESFHIFHIKSITVIPTTEKKLLKITDCNCPQGPQFSGSQYLYLLHRNEEPN